MTSDRADRRFAAFAGGCLLAGPLVGLTSALLQPTMKDGAAAQLGAVAAHHGPAVAAVAFEIATVPLLIVAVLGLSALAARDFPGWARIGAGFGVLGLLALMFSAALSSVQIEMVTGGADRAQMLALAQRISDGALGAAEPLTVLLAIGLVILAMALRRAGTVTTTAAAAIGLGAVLQPLGFGAGVRALAVLSFVLLLAGFAAVARAYAVSAAPAVEPVAAQAA
jgi:hypothetical protein